MFRCALAAAALAALAWSSPSPGASPSPPRDAAARPSAAIIAACAGGDSARIMIGRTEAEGSVFDSVCVRRADGTWTAPARLPSPRHGIPVVHRAVHWFLETRQELSGLQYHVLLPSTGELGVDGVRMECLSGLRSSAMSALDDWSFCLVDLGAGGALHARVIESKGPLVEMDVERETTWNPGWPEGTRLLAGGVAGMSFVAVAALPGGGFACATATGANAAAIPPPDLPTTGPVAACVTTDGPLVAVATGGAVLARAWKGGAWSPERRLDLPPGTATEALAATAVGDGRDKAVVVALTAGAGGGLRAAKVDASGFGALETCAFAQDQPAGALDTAPRARRAPEADAARAVSRLRTVRWAIAGAGAAVLVWLTFRLAATRR